MGERGAPREAEPTRESPKLRTRNAPSLRGTEIRGESAATGHAERQNGAERSAWKLQTRKRRRDGTGTARGRRGDDAGTARGRRGDDAGTTRGRRGDSTGPARRGHRSQETADTRKRRRRQGGRRAKAEAPCLTAGGTETQDDRPKRAPGLRRSEGPLGDEHGDEDRAARSQMAAIFTAHRGGACQPPPPTRPSYKEAGARYGRSPGTSHPRLSKRLEDVSHQARR